MDSCNCGQLKIDGKHADWCQFEPKKSLPELISQVDCKILHAALLAMVHDVHACQDNMLTETDWTRAEALFGTLNTHMNKVKK